jgi:hypothetical protein
MQNFEKNGHFKGPRKFSLIERNLNLENLEEATFLRASTDGCKPNKNVSLVFLFFVLVDEGSTSFNKLLPDYTV